MPQRAIIISASLVWITLLTVLLAGCRMETVSSPPVVAAAPPPAPPTPRESFFRKHPELRARYSEFYETSPDAMADAYERAITSEIVQADAIKQAYAKYPDVVEGLDGLTRHLKADRSQGLPLVDEIKKVFNPITDALFWYDYGRGNKQGQGYVIVRNGDFYRTFRVAGEMKRPDEIP